MPAALHARPPSRWLHRLRPPPSPHWRLGWRNVYVLPTRSGWMLLLVLLVLLLASINYQLSLGYLLTFLLAGSLAASVGVAHANVRGLLLHTLATAPVHAGQTLQIKLRLQAPAHSGKKVRRAIAVAVGQRADATALNGWSCVDIDGGDDTLLELGCATTQRGRMPLPLITVQTLFPLGAFRLWSHWQPIEHAWIYPAPEVPPPPLQHSDTQQGSGTGQTRPTVDAEPDGVRAYQRGDPLRHIVWKKAAQTLATGSHQLVSRSLHSARSDTRWLQESATSLQDPEARLSRLTAWALQMQHSTSDWGLQLSSGQAIAPAQGAAHFHDCMQALALYGPLRGRL